MVRFSHRDIFPLPCIDRQDVIPCKLSRCVKRRLHATSNWKKWANEGICSLNEIFEAQSTFSGKPGASQLACLDHIASAYKGVGKPPPSPSGALRELCGTS
eukprot:9853316-Karenia_brevis.AAC.1